MTREELRDYVDEQRGLDNIPYHVYSTLIDGIEALEQEPFINKPCVSSGVCEHDKQKVLGKIRAEIDKIYEREGNSVDCLNALDELQEFIDKYMAESEPQESEG